MDLVKFIQDQLSGDTLGKLSSLLGEDSETTRKAASAAVPAILTGLSGLAATDDGARKLASNINNLESSTSGGLSGLTNLARLLGGDSGDLLQKGGGLLSSLMGDGLVGSIASAISRYSGLDLAMTKRLLGWLMPMILGAVGMNWKKEGGSIGALSGLFDDQKRNIANAVPSGFNLANIPGLPSAEGALRAVGDTTRAAGATAANVARRTANAAEDTTKSLLMWLLPLAALLLLGAALWYFFGRKPGEPELAGKKEADTTARTALRPVVPDLPDIKLVSKDLTGVLTSATDTLGDIRDAASANAALPKLNGLSKKIDGIRDQLDKLPEAGQIALGTIVDAELEDIKAQVARISKIPGTEKLRPVLDSITSKLTGLNLAKVSQDATGIISTLTKTLNDFTDVESAGAAVPKLREVSVKLDELKRVRESMSPGGQSMLARLVAAARGPLDKLITKVVTALGADASVVKPILDEIVSKLTGLETPSA